MSFPDKVLEWLFSVVERRWLASRLPLLETVMVIRSLLTFLWLTPARTSPTNSNYLSCGLSFALADRKPSSLRIFRADTNGICITGNNEILGRLYYGGGGRTSRPFQTVLSFSLFPSSWGCGPLCDLGQNWILRAFVGLTAICKSLALAEAALSAPVVAIARALRHFSKVNFRDRQNFPVRSRTFPLLMDRSDVSNGAWNSGNFSTLELIS